MKKFVALLLAMLLVLANVAALAEGSEDQENLDNLIQNVALLNQNRGDDETTTNKIDTYFVKKYTTAVAGLFPTETLSFPVQENDNPAQITVAELNTANATAYVKVDGKYVPVSEENPLSNQKEIYYLVPVTTELAAKYGSAGKYTSTFKETPGTSQGVDYDVSVKPTVFTVDVYVVRDKTGTLTIDTVNIWTSQTLGADGKKPSEITNDYGTQDDNKFVDLTVSKETTGTYADVTKDFTIEIELKAETGKTVNADIAVAFTGNASAKIGETPITDKIEGKWTSKTITLTAHNGGGIVITNIPKGVKYTAKEIGVNRITPDDIPTWETSKVKYDTQDLGLNDENAYEVQNELADETEIGQGTTRTITNIKNITIPPTGITLETLPYVLIMMIALAGVAMLVSRKRYEV